ASRASTPMGRLSPSSVSKSSSKMHPSRASKPDRHELAPHSAPTGANAHAETPGSADSRRQGYPLSEGVGGGQEGWAALMLARLRVPMCGTREGSRSVRAAA